MLCVCVGFFLCVCMLHEYVCVYMLYVCVFVLYEHMEAYLLCPCMKARERCRVSCSFKLYHIALRYYLSLSLNLPVDARLVRGTFCLFLSNTGVTSRHFHSRLFMQILWVQLSASYWHLSSLTTELPLHLSN